MTGYPSREPKAKLALDEKKLDIRPAWRGNPAMDGGAQSSSGYHAGNSGGAQGKEAQLTQGDLSSCRESSHFRGNTGSRVERSQPTP